MRRNEAVFAAEVATILQQAEVILEADIKNDGFLCLCRLGGLWRRMKLSWWAGTREHTHCSEGRENLVGPEIR